MKLDLLRLWEVVKNILIGTWCIFWIILGVLWLLACQRSPVPPTADPADLVTAVTVASTVFGVLLTATLVFLFFRAYQVEGEKAKIQALVAQIEKDALGWEESRKQTVIFNKEISIALSEFQNRLATLRTDNAAPDETRLPDSYTSSMEEGQQLSPDIVTSLMMRAGVGDAEIQKHMARIDLSSGDSQKAVKTLLAAVKSAPFDHEAWIMLGLAYTEMYRWQLALEALEHGIMIGAEKTLQVRLALADVHILLGRLDLADEELRTAEVNDPREARVHERRALVKGLGEELEEAIEHLKHAIDLSPNYLPNRLRHAGLLMAMGADESARAVMVSISANPRANAYAGPHLVAAMLGLLASDAQPMQEIADLVASADKNIHGPLDKITVWLLQDAMAILQGGEAAHRQSPEQLLSPDADCLWQALILRFFLERLARHAGQTDATKAGHLTRLAQGVRDLCKLEPEYLCMAT